MRARPEHVKDVRVLLAGQVVDVVRHLVVGDRVVDPLAVGGGEQLLDPGRLLEHLVPVAAQVSRCLKEPGPAVLGNVEVKVPLQVPGDTHRGRVLPLLVQELAQPLRRVDAAWGRALVGVAGGPEPIHPLLRRPLEADLGVVGEVRVVV